MTVLAATLAGLALAAAPTTRLTAADPVVAPAAKPLDAGQLSRLRCIAALAIVASEQQRGSEGWDGYPPLAEDGATYAAIVGDAVMAESGQTREVVRDAILAAVAGFQKAPDGTDADIALRREADRCVPLMRAAVPERPKPDLPQCAAYAALAYDDVRGREGSSTTAKDMATIASVLDHRAREMLKAEGRTEPQVDEAMGLAKERIVAETKAGDGSTAPIDFSYCVQLAAP